MKKKDNEEFLTHLWEGIALVAAIVLVTYMVNRSDVRKKDRPSYRHSVHLIEDNIAGF